MDTILIGMMLGLLALCAWGPWIAALVSAARIPEPVWKSVGRSKTSNMTLMFLTGWAGALYFWIRLRPNLRLGDMSRVPARPPKPDMWTNGVW